MRLLSFCYIAFLFLYGDIKYHYKNRQGMMENVNTILHNRGKPLL